MSDKTFVFAADRHGREDDAEGDIYIGAGDEIYTTEAGEEAEGIEDFESGIYGNADSEEEVAKYAAGELNERFAQLDEEYDEAYLALGNHEDELLDKNLVKQIADQYDNVHIKENEHVEIEGRNFYFGESFQSNEQEEKIYEDEVSAEEAGYEEDDLEAVGEALDKEADEVTCEDIDSMLDGEIEEDTSSDSGSKWRDTLEGIPLLGKYIFQPLYRLKDRYLGAEADSSEPIELPDIEKTEEHEQIDEMREEYEEMLEQKVEEIEDIEGEVTYVTHGQPQTEEMPYASIQTREILERADNIESAYVGHFHGGFDGEQEAEIGGVDVINPQEGYTVDETGGALEQYETHGFEGNPVADAESVELNQSEPEDQPDLSEEEREKAQQIIMEAQQQAEDEEEMHQIVQQRMQEEGIPI